MIMSYCCLIQPEERMRRGASTTNLKLEATNNMYTMISRCAFTFNAYLISSPFLMKIHVKYFRHDSYKMTLQILTTPIDEVIIGFIFVQVSTAYSHQGCFIGFIYACKNFFNENEKEGFKKVTFQSW